MATILKISASEFHKISIHATLTGGDETNSRAKTQTTNFYPRHPHGWRRHRPIPCADLRGISIHATLTGGDPPQAEEAKRKVIFLSTPPSRVATPQMPCLKLGCMHFYPRHPHGWRPLETALQLCNIQISIHATLTGGDPVNMAADPAAAVFLSTPPSRVATITSRAGRRPTGFLSTPPSRVATSLLCAGVKCIVISIHATLTGGDDLNLIYYAHQRIFLSTPPSRVATRKWFVIGQKFVNFYPRHPHGWRRCATRSRCWPCSISIHATLTGGDIHHRLLPQRMQHFYPRHPHGWRRPSGTPSRRDSGHFYPRHPHGWRQHKDGGQGEPEKYFYPRHPHGWRLPIGNLPSQLFGFLSTPPSRVATGIGRPAAGHIHISIHATLTGGDCPALWSPFSAHHFYPRHPHGWRRCSALSSSCAIPISIHATLTGGDVLDPVQTAHIAIISIHATLTGGDSFNVHFVDSCLKFLSTPPSRVATCSRSRWWRRFGISIHATLTGGDSISQERAVVELHFYPRHPHGWRRQKYTNIFAHFCL